ncbi:hypothetical protein, partial [Zavarzinella formosa]|uniref:hypothetical protein n=1 Tax=Zavarzinella formosa TaxID=360055 RepID=UPI000495A3BC
MTFDMARPHYTLPLAGKEYQLLGTFALIEAAELVMKDYIGNVAVRVVNGMPSYEAAKLLSVILTASGHPVTVDEAKDLIWLDGVANQVTRMHLYSFLKICLAPPGQREAEATEMGELMGSLKASL